MPRKGENIYKRKDGRWEGRYIGCYDENHKAKYVYIYGKTYTEVKQKLAIERGRQKQHVPAEKKQITYGEVLDLWLHSTKTSIKESTYCQCCKLHTAESAARPRHFSCPVPLHHSDNAFNNIVHISKVTLTVAIVENFDGFALHQLVGESEVSHVRTACRTIHGEEAQTRGRNVVELGVCVCHQLIRFLGGCIK